MPGWSAHWRACRADRVETTGSTYPIDVRTRHPIVLADSDRTLDVFPTGVGHLDPRQTADVDAFMLEFRRYGRGTLLMEVPRGGPPAQAASAERTAAAVPARAQVDSPEFKQATNFYVDLVRKHGEAGAPQAGFTECLNNTQQGKTAMWYDATSAAGYLEAVSPEAIESLGVVHGT